MTREAHASVLGGRFVITRELRPGAGRSLREGIESGDGRAVLVESAPEEAVSPATLMRLEHARSALPEGIPGLVAPVRAVGTGDGRVHLVTSPPPGLRLADRPAGPMPLRDALAVAVDLLSALAELHGRGILHRDLDAAAVTLREEDTTRATITAAGLAADVALIASVADLPAEEVRHLAPEASGLIAGGVDERSDLYSAGVLIHLCVTGRPPREAGTAAELLRETLAGPVRGLRAWVPDAPWALEAAVGRLLERDPRDRYQSARAAAADLAAIAAGVARGESQPEVVLGALDERATLTEPAFVGRRAELEALEEQIRRTREGDGGLVLVEGISGGGKSRLLDELVHRAGGEVWVLRGGAVDQAAAHPFQLLSGVVREVVRAASGDPALLAGVTERLGDQAVAASAAMPELAEIVGPADEHGLGPEQHAETRSVRSLAVLLDALGAPGREALVILDDVQWADELSLRLLHEWSRERAAGGGRTLVVAAFREEEVPPDHALRELPARERVVLPPLGAEEVSSLAVTMAGALPPEALDAVARLSGGNPFMATAVLRGLVESAAITPDGGRWRVSRAALDDVNSSRAAADVLLARMDLLPADTLALLTAGAVLGKGFEVELAATLAAQDPGDAMTSLAEARRRSIVWADRSEFQVSFVHDKLREALLARADAGALAALHRSAARRIEESHPERVFELAYHYSAGGEAARAVPHAMRAAALARRRHALAAAERQYRIAQEGEAHLDAAGRRALALGLGDVLMMGGAYEEAQEQLERARAMSDAPVEQAAIDARLGELAFKRGEVAAASEAYERGLRLLGQRVPHTMGGFVRRALREVLVQVAHSLAPALLVGRRAPVDEDGAEMLAVRLHSRLAYPYWFGRGAIPTLWSHLRGMNLAERYPPTLELAQAYSEHAPVMTVLPWFSRGLDYADRSLAIRREMGDVWGQGQSLHFRGVVLYGASRYRECIASCEEAVALLARTGDRWEMNTAAWHVAICNYRLGDLAAAAQRAREVHRAGREIGDPQAAGIALGIWSKATDGGVPQDLVAEEMARGGADVHTHAELVQAEALRLIAAGRHGPAASMLRSTLRTVERRGFRQEYVAPLAPWLATALRLSLEQRPALTRPRRARAARRARRAARRAVWWSRSYRNNLPHALRERALVMALTGSGSRADALLARSAAEAERQGAVYELALTRHAQARLAADRAEPGAAEALRAAELELAALRGHAAADPRAAAALSLADRFDAVLHCGRQIAAALTPAAVVEAARSAATILLRAERTEVTPLVGGAPVLHGAWPAGEPPPDPERILNGEPLVVEPEGGGSHMLVAIHADGRPAAILDVHHSRMAGLFGPEEVRLAEYIATLTGAALENAATTARLEHQAFHDALTGLPNRALVLDRLSQALLRAERRGDDLCVMLLDLDDFKHVNDSLGHAAGDRLLAMVAERLRGVLRPADTPARLGGDEFAVVLEATGVDEAEGVAERILDAFGAPFEVGGREVYVSAAIGIATAAEGERNPETLVRDADAAMYAAKARGKRGHALFVPQMRTAAVARLEMETRLRRAIERGELEIAYQPIVRIEDGGVAAVEALVRWRHPDAGVLLPGRFIPLAEETGLIDEIGEWVLRTACGDVGPMLHRGETEATLPVTVNLSPRQLRDPRLADRIATVLVDTRFAPERLILEITESAMAADTPGNLSALRALRGAGVRVAVDDFGSGYSSLAQLRRLPVDMLKVDREFLAEVRSPAARALLRAIVELGGGLGLSVVAEGVERDDQLTLARGVGCALGQGWLWARPMPAAGIRALLES